jgi:hypothetical protein
MEEKKKGIGDKPHTSQKVRSAKDSAEGGKKVEENGRNAKSLDRFVAILG